jgi:NAD(P)-dependent dehydrogenase (short-subunit alcohol dehydrogenase family)
MKTVLITGTTSGIGEQLALDYAALGWSVIACGRNAAKLAKLSEHNNISTLAFDMSDIAEVEAAGNQIDKALDLVVLNAGTCEYMDDIKKFDTALFRRVINSNVLGTADCIAAFLPKIPRGGQLALMGSSANFFPFSRAQAYGASKAAVAYLAQTLAVDLAKYEISVSLISPGFVETPLTNKNDFEMPMRISVEQASAEIIKGVEKRKHHVTTPKLFTFLLGLLGKLPHSIQHWLALRTIKE